jgi:hypothetical protein
MELDNVENSLTDAETAALTKQFIRTRLKQEAAAMRRPGWTYYAQTHAVFVLKTILVAVKSTTKKVTLNTMRVDRTPETIYQKFKQGHTWLVDASEGVLSTLDDVAGMSEEDFKTAIGAIKDVAITKQGINIVITYSPPEGRRATSDDEMLALLSEEQINEATDTMFREEFTQFLADGPLDQQASWENVNEGDAAWAQQLAQQDVSILLNYSRKNNTLVCVKQSEETMKALG